MLSKSIYFWKVPFSVLLFVDLTVRVIEGGLHCSAGMRSWTSWGLALRGPQLADLWVWSVLWKCYRWTHEERVVWQHEEDTPMINLSIIACLCWETWWNHKFPRQVVLVPPWCCVFFSLGKCKILIH